jgi:non-specific serine/threonine protein kinase
VDAPDGLCPRCLLDLGINDSSESLTGQTVSHYQVLDQLSMGGMGVVYKAKDTRLGRFVAIKFVRDEIADDPAATGRFEREALAVATLHHPNICPFFDFGDHDGRSFLVTELLEGQPLDQVMATGALAIEDILEYARQIAEGLKVAHSKGFVHRDIKPSNLFLTNDREVKLLDFGLAKPLQWDSSMAASIPTLTGSDMVAGTIPYMSPEQLQAKTVDGRTDLFSLGVVLYEMTAGQLPFKAASTAETIAAIQREDPVPLHQLNSEVGRPFSDLVGRLLSRDADQRHSDAGELLADLEQVRSPQTIGDSSRRFIPAAVVMLLMAAALLLLIVAVPRVLLILTPEQDLVVNTIAVVPFENLSGPEHEPITIAIANRVRQLLADADIDDLRVRPRTMTAIYGTELPPVRELIDVLDVDAIIGGTVQVLGDELILVLEVSDENQVLIARQYDGPLGDAFAFSVEIARDVASEIRTSSSAEAVARDNVPDEALLLYSQGQTALDRRTPGAFRTAIDFFSRAITIHPEYADAFAGRAHANVVLGTTGYSNRPSGELEGLMEDVRLDVDQALLIDPDLAEAHTVNAMLLMAYDWDLDQAGEAFDRAIDIDPDFAEARHWHALYLAGRGDLEGALAEVEMAQRLDRGSPLIAAALGRIHYYRKEFALAEASYEAALSIEPDSVPARLGLLLLYLQMERFSDFGAAVERSISLPLEQGPALITDLLGFAINGEFDRAEASVIESAEAEGFEISALYFAIFWKLVGDVVPMEPDRVLLWLERAADEKSDYMNYINVEPLFEQYRPEPRFVDLLETVGLAP